MFKATSLYGFVGKCVSYEHCIIDLQLFKNKVKKKGDAIASLLINRFERTVRQIKSHIIILKFSVRDVLQTNSDSFFKQNNIYFNKINNGNII